LPRKGFIVVAGIVVAIYVENYFVGLEMVVKVVLGGDL
jgi:hypothetical protein